MSWMKVGIWGFSRPLILNLISVFANPKCTVEYGGKVWDNMDLAKMWYQTVYGMGVADFENSIRIFKIQNSVHNMATTFLKWYELGWILDLDVFWASIFGIWYSNFQIQNDGYKMPAKV